MPESCIKEGFGKRKTDANKQPRHGSRLYFAVASYRYDLIDFCLGTWSNKANLWPAREALTSTMTWKAGGLDSCASAAAESTASALIDLAP